MCSSQEIKRIKIKALNAANIGVSKSATILKCTRNTVRRWINRNDTRTANGRGRKTKVTPITKSIIEREMRDKIGASLRKCAKVLNSSEHYKSRCKTISTWAIRRYLKSTDWGKSAYKIPAKPLLSKINVIDRLNFSLMIQKDGYCDPRARGQSLRSHILFTDESIVELHPKPNRQNTRVRTKDISKIKPIQVPKHSRYIMIAGGICTNGKTQLIVLPEETTITAPVYREQILPFYTDEETLIRLFPNRKKITFMQDSATSHTERTNMNIINAKFDRVWSLKEWPGNSPDVNPIEHIWSKLQDSVFKEPRPFNRETLIKRVREE